MDLWDILEMKAKEFTQLQTQEENLIIQNRTPKTIILQSQIDSTNFKESKLYFDKCNPTSRTIPGTCS